jgi:hypothetical protein
MTTTLKVLWALFSRPFETDFAPGCSPKGGFRVPLRMKKCTDGDSWRLLSWNRGNDMPPRVVCVDKRSLLQKKPWPARDWSVAVDSDEAIKLVEIPSWVPACRLGRIPPSIESLRTTGAFGLSSIPRSLQSGSGEKSGGELDFDIGTSVVLGLMPPNIEAQSVNDPILPLFVWRCCLSFC